MEPRSVARDPGEGSRGFLFYQRIRKGLRIMIKVDLKGSEKEFESGVSVAEVAKSIGMGLYKSACAAKVNGEVCDLRTVLNEDCKVEILTFDDKEGKKAYWHTASHIMAQAVNRLYPAQSSPLVRLWITASIMIWSCRRPSPTTTSQRSKPR